jgi:hypothetical protein
MEFYFLQGFFKSFKSKPKSEIGLISAKKAFREVLAQLNVTNEDPCCETIYAPVRYNRTTNRLEYLSNAELGTYTQVPTAALA